MREEFIIYNQADINTHLINTQATGYLTARMKQVEGPHRHVLDKDRQIRRHCLRLTTELEQITSWPAMKKTDDLSLFVLLSCVLNLVKNCDVDDC